jgi:hypothetical protein
MPFLCALILNNTAKRHTTDQGGRRIHVAGHRLSRMFRSYGISRGSGYDRIAFLRV